MALGATWRAWLGRPRLRGWPSLSLIRRAARLGRRALRRTLAVLAVLLPDILAVELLLAATAYLFRDALQEGLIFHEADTTTMFYPVFAALGRALGRGELLVWSPYLFSGFPLLAEGQTGALYPANWLAAALLPTQQGFIWLRVVHFALGTLFSYIFGRTLRLAPGPAAIVALSFGFGSFMVGQMQHASIVASAIWLPLILACTEMTLQANGLARLRYLLLAGLAMGVAAVGVHIQTIVMSGGCFLGWVAFRLLFPRPRLPADPPEPRLGVSRRRARAWRARRAQAHARSWLPGSGRVWRSPRSLEWLLSFHAFGSALWRLVRAVTGRLTLGACVALLVPGLAMAVAAAQLLPLYELSAQSGRSGNWSYRDASDYSLPLPNLLTLVFPFFFRDNQGGGWSLWQPWEVTYYAGVVPLALAVLGVVYARRRETFFFVALVTIATLLALGDYSPLNLYQHVWSLPGLNLQRAPARFSYLGVLGIAVLAGFGSQMLWENLRTWPSGARRTLRFLVIWMAGLLVALAALIWHLVSWRAWLEAEPLWALKIIETSYLSLRRDPGAIDSAQKVYSGLWQSLDLTNPRTALPLLLLGALLLLTVCWNEFRRVRALWQSGLVLLVVIDLAAFAHEYHPLVSIDEVAQIGETGRFLARQSGLFRLYTHAEVRQPRANVLLPWEVAESRAYDPLELSRHRVFLGSVTYVDNWLLDLLGIRYRVMPTEQTGLPSYRQTGFHPQHPLISGAAGNPAGRDVWRVSGDQADELRVVSVLEDAFAVSTGEQVAEWLLTDTGGRVRTIPMLAGRDTADWTYDDPIYSARPSHQRAQVAFTFDLPFPLPSGARQVNLYYASFPLPDRPIITRAEFRQTSRDGRMQIFGFGLYNQDRNQVAQFYEREKYRVVLNDSGVLVQENSAVFPRAFAVPEALVASSASDALGLLAHGPIRPRRQVVLETDDSGLAPTPLPEPAPSRAGDPIGEPYGEVEIVDYGDDVVSIRARTDGGYLVLADAYYPGWKAYVDGQETAVLRGDYLFRAVELPPGQHSVQFRFQSDSFETGLAISRLTLALIGLTLIVSLTPTGRLLRPVWMRTP